MDYTYDPAFKCFPSSGFLLCLNKGDLKSIECSSGYWLCPCRGMSKGKWITFISWSLWQSSESFDGMPCRNYTVIPCTSFLGEQRVPIFGAVRPATAPSQSKCSPTHSYMDRSANFLGGEFPFTALPSRKECCSFGMKSQSDSSAAWNDLPYVLNWQSPDVPRNECDEDCFLFRVICGKSYLELSWNCFMANSIFGHEGILLLSTLRKRSWRKVNH